MRVFDLYHDIKVLPELAAASTIDSNTNTDGSIIDTAYYESLTFVIQAGTITDGDYSLQIIEGDESDLSDGAVTDSEMVLGSDTVFAAADDDTVKRIGYIGKKQYARLRIVSTNVTTGGAFGAIAILGTPHHAPVAED